MFREQQEQVRRLHKQQGIKPRAMQQMTEAWNATLEAKIRKISCSEWKHKERDLEKQIGVETDVIQVWLTKQQLASARNMDDFLGHHKWAPTLDM